MNPNSKTYKKIKPLAPLILSGKILSVDPSTGSAGSMPGYACFTKGKLIESGILEVNYRQKTHLKLYEIAKSIREEFEMPDILLVEQISIVIYKGSKISPFGMSSLQRSIGAIIGARPFPNLIEIPAASWKKYKPDNYIKTDEFDSVSIGLCAIEVAKEIIKNNE